MKVVLVQPYFSNDIKDLEKCYKKLIDLMDECSGEADIIVFPEYCDVPINTRDDKVFINCIKKYNNKVIDYAIKTAKRCNSLVFINAASECEKGYRNTTYAINRKGEIVGKYFKSHLAPSEYSKFDYSYRKNEYEPYIIEIEGIRFAFLTCYDFYFYEDLILLAREKPDIIIGCSHQRTDTHEALSIFSKFISYNTNSYLLRSSISFGDNEHVCGCSMVCAPNGYTLLNMKNKIGIDSIEIDVRKKYYKPAGYMGKTKSHYEYVDEGRQYLSKKDLK